MKKIIAISAAVLSAFAFAATSQAQVVSVQYNIGSASNISSSAGFIPETVWNVDSDTTNVPYFSPGYMTSTNLLDSNSHNSGITETLTTDAAYHQGSPVTGFSGAGDNNLFNGGPFTVGDGSSSGTLTLDGLQSKLTYNLFLYINDPNGASGTLVNVTNDNNAQSFYLTTGANAYDASYPSNPVISSYVLGSAATAGNAKYGDYFELTGLTGSSELNVYLASGGAELNGFQLQVAPATPEPSTWAMMLGGMAILVVMSRRRALKI